MRVVTILSLARGERTALRDQVGFAAPHQAARKFGVRSESFENLSKFSTRSGVSREKPAGGESLEA